MEKRKETVHHPQHYNMGKYEVIVVIEDWKLGFHLGNTVKYIARAGHKHTDHWLILEDLKKARWYLERKLHKLKYSWSNRFKPKALRKLIDPDTVSKDWKLTFNLSKVLAYIRLTQTHGKTKQRTVFFLHQALTWLDSEISYLGLPPITSPKEAEKIGKNLSLRKRKS